MKATFSTGISFCRIATDHARAKNPHCLSDLFGDLIP